MLNIRNRGARNVSTRRADAADTEQARARTLIGVPHLVVGAIGLVLDCVGVLTAGALTPVLLIPVALRVVVDGLTAYAGLLITDGYRRGAILAIVTGVLRLALLLLGARFGLTLVITVLLIGGAVWLLPSLESTTRTPQGRSKLGSD